MQHQLTFVVYGVLVCLGLIPAGILGVSVYAGSMIVLHAIREALREGVQREEESYTYGQKAEQGLAQPALKMYAVGRGWYVVGYVARHLFSYANASSNMWMKQAAVARYVASKHMLLAIPAWSGVIGLYVVARLLYLSALLSALLFLPLYSVALFCWGAGAQLALIAFSVFYFLQARALPLRCPHCYHEMPIPIHLCPSCEAEHSRLWPNNYGIFAHRCIRCQTRLPTFDLLGRQRLARVCPSCHHGLPPRIADGAGVHIALVGAPAAGKTSYLMMALREWRQTHARSKLLFIDAAQQQRMDDAQQRFKQGQTLSPTKEITPHAYTLKMQKPGRKPSQLLYLYDPAGDAFASDAQANRQTYYKYCHGIVLIIDPLSIVGPLKGTSAGPRARRDAPLEGPRVIAGESPTVSMPLWPSYAGLSQKHAVEEEVHKQEGRELLPGGALAVMQIYERMMRMLELSAGVGKRKRYRQPIAVVLSKVDQLQLNNEIGLPAARVLMKYDPKVGSEAEALSRVARAFLCEHGLANLVRDLELHFAHVGYFSCSALGRTPTTQEKRAFESERTLEPLRWVLEQRGIS